MSNRFLKGSIATSKTAGAERNEGIKPSALLIGTGHCSPTAVKIGIDVKRKFTKRKFTSEGVTSDDRAA